MKQQIQVRVVFLFPWQKSEGCHRGWHQHARRCAFWKCSVRRDRTPEMAVWCLVTWCHTGQSYGSRRCARVREQDAETIKTFVHRTFENGDKKASMFSSTGEFTSPRSHWSTWMVPTRWKTGMDRRETLTWRSMVSSHIWSSIQRCYNTLMNTLKPQKGWSD